MGPLNSVAPFHRDLALAVLAVALLTAPLWAATLSLGEPVTEYDRVEVTTDGDGVAYADPDAVPPETPISESIECAGWGGDVRACSFEEHLLEVDSLPTSLYSTNPNSTSVPWTLTADYYDYVQLDDRLYEVAYETNASAQRSDGMYRVDITLEPADPDDVLRWESIDVDDADLPSVVADTARDGSGTSRDAVDVPESPIELEDGTYYRVYQERGERDPPTGERPLSAALTFVSPVVGLIVLVRLSRRVEISYVGAGENDDDTGDPSTENQP
ncbi:hypothetical protein [Natronorubrum tibetense]|uniref:Uncharacterized protein n=1 Tax=Natronorubrum tibetense GA33 TaxID=1114856 RepID=L9WDI4_9EURY|nr:hypothetical protein [Natronorubrum tibetense]ELY46393.1 hypothetical protein C496_00575 [Natronorubrum tibetense GA33]